MDHLEIFQQLRFGGIILQGTADMGKSLPGAAKGVEDLRFRSQIECLRYMEADGLVDQV